MSLPATLEIDKSALQNDIFDVIRLNTIRDGLVAGGSAGKGMTANEPF
jgi:hypothetical protein